jgi:predicted nucleic acid-binding Zn ribbon protein
VTRAGSGGRRSTAAGSNAAGPVRGPESFADILKKLAGDLRLEERRREGALGEAFAEAAGPELSKSARVTAFRAGVLTVEVDGAARLDEVRRFRAYALLESVRARPGGEKVRELRFVPAGRSK